MVSDRRHAESFMASSNSAPVARVASNLAALPQAVLAHWQAVAMMAANPLTDEEREQIERANAGDFSGLLSWNQDENGSWVRL